MEKYLITLDCNCMEKGCLYPCHLKGEVFANSFEEAFEKYTKGKVFCYYLVVDDYCKEEYNISDDNEIIVTASEEDDE